MVAGDRVLGVIQVQSTLPARLAPSDAELLGMVGNTAAVAIQNARLFAETQRGLERLRSLHAIDLAITGSVDVHVTLGILLDQVLTHLRVDAADVLLQNPLSQVLEHTAGKGFRARGLERVRVRIGEGPAGRAALERKVVRFLRDAAGAMDVARAPLLAEEGVVGYAAAPMVARGHVVGVLEVFGRAPLAPDPEWLEFLEGLASQAAIAVDSAALFSDLKRRNVELMLAQDTALETLARALDLREAGAGGHAQRVADLAVRLAREMGMREEDVVHLRRGALLHDVGKIAIPDTILLKPGPLTAEEREVVRRHPQAAHDLLAPVAFLRPALDVVYCHHERWDGSGYPRGLKGEEIPLPARIFSVANVYDALTSDRPWRKAWPEGQARDYVRDNAGSEFDPGVVQVFLGMLRAARS
jgi:GAF domain-containing protein